MAQAAFEDVVAELAKYFSVSKSLGGNVATQADHIQKAVNLSKEFIGKALGMKKPGESDLMAMLGPISQEMSKVGEIKDKGRGDKNFNNLNAAAEGVQALGWLAVEPKPGPFIKETTGSAQFWTNKILKEFKGNNEDQVAWATSLVAFLQALEKYVMQYHTTGVAWNSGGAAKAAAPASAPAAGGGSSSIQTEFEELIASHLNPFVELSQKIGGPVASQVALLKQATQLELEVVIKAAGSKEKPKPEEFMEKWLKPISTLMTQIAEFPAKNRGHANFDHLSSVGEGAQILGWVAVEPTPAPFAKEVIPSAQFWTNKILKNFKGKDETQVAWANGLVAFLQAFPPYIASHHTTGLKFNATIANKAAPVQTATATGGASLTDFDNLVSEHVQPYLQLSAKIGDVVNQQAQLVDQAVKQLRQLIEHAGKTKPKPSPDAFQKLLTPIVEPMTKVTELKDKNRSSKYFDHLNATAEAISTIGWVTVEPAPAPFAKETAGGAVFYTNKILKLYKGKEEDHVEWVKHLNGFFQGLEGYIKQHHMTGLSWGTAANKPAAVQAAPAGGGGGCVDDFQAIIDEFITPYVTISKELGGVVAQQAELVLTAVKHEKELIGKAKTMKKPSEDALMQMIKPIGDTMAKVSELKEKNRKDPLWNHLSTVAEGISILGWVTVEPTPGPFAKEAIGSSEFWSNKILKDVRGKDEKQENWVKAFNGFLKAIPGYIQQHHTTGLSWSK